MLLGIAKPVIKAHGSSKARAIRSAIAQAKQVVEQGVPFAQAVAQAAGLPLACTTVPAAAARQVADRETTHRAPNEDRQTYYPVQVYVRTPWE